MGAFEILRLGFTSCTPDTYLLRTTSLLPVFRPKHRQNKAPLLMGNAGQSKCLLPDEDPFSDPMGNIKYHEPSYAVQKGGRIIEADPVGNKQYHKQQLQLKDGKVYQADSYGNIQHHKPGFVVK